MEVFVLLNLVKAHGRHFCKIEGKGRYGSFNYVVMTLAGKSLENLRKEGPGQHMSMGTAISVGIQCLEALEDLHGKSIFVIFGLFKVLAFSGIGFIHRDIKPANYAVGRIELNEQRKVYILDFGMCRKFTDARGKHYKARARAGFRGTVSYAPISCHMQRELCRKDDVEVWVYMLVELITGKLPWFDIEDDAEVGEYKRRCRSEPAIKELFGGCPRELMEILQMIDNNKYYDAPNYQMCYQLMRKAMVSMNAQEFPYDWEKPAADKKHLKKTHLNL